MSNKYLLDEKQQFINGIGTELAWGWSPAIDFTEFLNTRKREQTLGKGPEGTSEVVNPTVSNDKKSSQESSCLTKEEKDIESMIATIKQRSVEDKERNGSDEPGDVRVLLCGACDIRHVFRTLSSLRVKGSLTSSGESVDPTWHFYFYEPNLRVHARHLFFLKWLLDSTFSLDELEERVLMFLDVFGNAMTRDTTAAQVRNVAQQLLNALRSEGGGDLAELVSFAEMKEKERDFVEQQILHWTRDRSVAHVEETRSKRLRQEMAERFDNRDNIIDWDFHFHLNDYTNLIKFTEYRTWRNNGVAFDATHINPRREFTYTYSVPNKTLCHFNNKGDGVFLGDVKNGPFFALGAQTANTHIRSRTFDGTCKYGNGVVSMHNIRAWLYGLMTGLRWPWSDHLFAWDDASNYNWLPEGTPKDVTHQTTLPKVKFHFIGLDLDRFLKRMRDKGRQKFDTAFVGTGCTQFMTPSFFEIAMMEDAVVVAETAKFVIDMRDEGKKAFVNKICELARAANWNRNEDITKSLHKDQPDPQKVDENSSNNKAALMAKERYEMPYQIALTRCCSVVA
ncbi:hypothetical protein DPX39_110018500 [Trypanosoma brucei equiperdum]|uniref:Dynein assembly factor 3, axonemal n=1 Tax=Trypanosoma brucei equiperdum TaxID=630700 RepID=A0A3L6KTV6_9TRYP|nr:hypothetical protein DPX39_110018500 [Trypanosoma brucei equiperdum]